MRRKAIIISLSGYYLSQKEKNLMKEEKPWGIILFKRNIESFKQTQKLINSVRNIMRDNKYPILIDEEGGQVCRMSKFFDNSAYSQKLFGDIFIKNQKLSLNLYSNYINTICSIFKLLGININTVPVLDLLKEETHKVIGNRSFSNNKKIIKKLGSLCIDIYKKNRISTVIKHIPGHGSATVDSHKKLPKVNINFKYLSKFDFDCFRGMNSQFAMTAHVLYSKIDKNNVSTHSETIISKIIRKKIGFRGILISDDISMKALKYDLITNALKSLKAGCNLVLYCSGKYNESKKLLKHIPLIDSFTKKKTSEFYKFLS